MLYKKGLGWPTVVNSKWLYSVSPLSQLGTKFIGNEIRFYKNIRSTQTLAISLAEKTENVAGTVVIAEQQSDGVGRIGRKWISPKGGIWLSVILRPKIPITGSTLISFAAAIAVSDTINRITKLNSRLKWPNDIVIKGKKVAGILLDLAVQNKSIKYAVIGIGINANVNASKISSKIDNSPTFFGVTSLNSELSDRNINKFEFIKVLLETLEYYYLKLENEKNVDKIIDKWKEGSDMLNKAVKVKTKHKCFDGVAVGIDKNGALFVKTTGGRLQKLISDDVMIRSN
jgi:BirA family transcriptional regulator, biotin operon repressor / biotin---[acetyl-CoA-carboxylase] ligase